MLILYDTNLEVQTILPYNDSVLALTQFTYGLLSQPLTRSNKNNDPMSDNLLISWHRIAAIYGRLYGYDVVLCTWARVRFVGAFVFIRF